MSKSISDTSSISKIKQAIQKLNVIDTYYLDWNNFARNENSNIESYYSKK